MATFADLKAEIAVDIDRTDLTTQINQAVLDAVELHSTMRFWFNETRSFTFNTTASDRDYVITPGSGVEDFLDIDFLRLEIVGDTDRVLHKRIHQSEMEERTVTTGKPTEWSYYNSTFFFHPIPDATYTIRVGGHVRLTALTAAGDTNAWTTHARALVRATARKFLYGRTIRNRPEELQVAQMDEDRELNRLIRETRRRRGDLPLYVDDALMPQRGTYNIMTG